MNSAVYEGSVVHHRRTPIDHRFSYRIALPLVDLDELDQLCRLHPLWSHERHNVISFWRRDYLPDRSGTLADAVRDLAGERLGWRPSGPVAMLAHPRTWGWLFNPISLYYCYAPDARRVEALVAEVTNTPWHERHVYALGGPGRYRFAKQLHVSPFFDTDMDYELTYDAPGSRLSVQVRTVRSDKSLLRAGYHLQRREIDARALGRLIWGHPLTTMRVSAGIYREALALFRAGAPISAHPPRRVGASAACGALDLPTHAHPRRSAPNGDAPSPPPQETTHG